MKQISCKFCDKRAIIEARGDFFITHSIKEFSDSKSFCETHAMEEFNKYLKWLQSTESKMVQSSIDLTPIQND